MSEFTESGDSTVGLTLRDYTPARVSLRRSGVSLATSEVLGLQLAHAQARDAVHAVLDAEVLAERLRIEIKGLAAGPILVLSSGAPDRVSYLRRPDLGRVLSAASAGLLSAGACDIALVIADGLSATAVERHAVPLLAALLPMLPEEWRVGPVSIVAQGRVAVADEIGARLGARISLILIGERPGLSSPDSLGAYITWAPGPGRTDAERNCVSNIHAAGLDYAAAAARIWFYCREARRLQVSGTVLKEVDRLLE